MVTATAANGKRQQPTALRDARTLRGDLGYARPEKQTVRGRRAGRPLGATMGATAANNLLGFRTSMNNGQEHGQGHGLIRTGLDARTWNYGEGLGL